MTRLLAGFVLSLSGLAHAQESHGSSAPWTYRLNVGGSFVGGNLYQIQLTGSGRLTYDKERVGLKIETAEKVPTTKSKHERRQWFDTSGHGKSAAGHDFPAKLSKPQRRALLEYLKTL